MMLMVSITMFLMLLSITCFFRNPVQNYCLKLTPEVSRVKKMQKNALFYGNGVGFGVIF